MRIVLAALIVVLALPAGSILATGAPLLESPGVFARLSAYLTSNSVATQSISAFPERELTTYRRPRGTVFNAAEAAVQARGWEIIERDPEDRRLHALARTPLWGFRDDVIIRISTTETGANALHIRSSSRTGLADFGANTARLIELRAAIEERL